MATENAAAKARREELPESARRLVELTGVSKVYYRGKEPLRVLDKLNLEIHEGRSKR